MTTRQVSELIDDLIDLADLYDMEVRHPRPRLMRYLTQSLRGVRNEITVAGFQGLLDWSTPAALPTAPPITGENHLEVAWPTGATEIHGVDVNDGARWYPLDTMVLAERRDFYADGRPRAFWIRSLPKEATPPTTALDTTSGKIQIYPSSALGLSYRVLYLPAYPELTSETSVVQGFDGDWIQWALWNAVIMALFKDDEADPSQDAKAVRERDIVKTRIVTNINRTNRAGPISPRRAGGVTLRRR